MNWSMTTKSPGTRSSRRLPTADKRDDVGDLAALQCIDIGAIIDLGGRQNVPASMARNEYNWLSVERSEAEFVRGRAERACHSAPFDIRKPFDLVKPAPADDADNGPGHAAGLKRRPSFPRKRESRTARPQRLPLGPRFRGGDDNCRVADLIGPA